MRLFPISVKNFIRRSIIAVLTLLSGILPSSCSLDDGRDACCNTNRVRFRYMTLGNDRFADKISSVRYLLFDGTGGFIDDIAPLEGSPNIIDIKTLRPGTYTIIAVGNLNDYATLDNYAEKGLQNFHLTVAKYHELVDGAFANGDRLYWGECNFTVTRGATNSFIGEMSNIHCVLHVKVEWDYIPEHQDGYHLHLEGIGTRMEMHSGNADAIDDKRFPLIKEFVGRMAEEATFRQHKLDATMVTLRWNADNIPSLKLYHNEDSVTKSIRLGYLFKTWNWNPAKATEQEYDLLIRLRTDGQMEIQQGFDTGVKDWEDGGTLG